MANMATLSVVSMRSLQPLPPSSSQSLFPLLPQRHLASNFTSFNPVHVSFNSPWMDQSRSTKSVRAMALASTYPENVADALGEVGILTATGESVLFKDLWDQNEGIAVVALLRHFGCICCWELASSLKEVKPKFDSAGVKLIAVGVGTPNKAQILAEKLPFPSDCLYADPERKAYDLLGLYFGVGRTFFNRASLKVFSRIDSLKKAGKNYTIKATPDDRSGVLQQGGMFVFKGKQLLYAWKDEGTGDHAPLDDIFDVCCKVPVS